MEVLLKYQELVHRQTTRNNIPADSPEQYDKRFIFFPYPEHFIYQLKNIFTNYYLLMSKLQLLIPKFLNNNTDFKIFARNSKFL